MNEIQPVSTILWNQPLTAYNLVTDVPNESNIPIPMEYTNPAATNLSLIAEQRAKDGFKYACGMLFFILIPLFFSPNASNYVDILKYTIILSMFMAYKAVQKVHQVDKLNMAAQLTQNYADKLELDAKTDVILERTDNE